MNAYHIKGRNVNDDDLVKLKDVDGFVRYSKFDPCTPAGIMEMLKYEGIDVAGKNCVVIGRSNIVGKPVALELLKNDGTVTICHSKTKNLKLICREADILICAIGKPKFFNKEYISPDAVVIDVGVHRLEDGSMCGDVDFEDVKDVVSVITPVPGGVGPMTITMLLQNTLTAAEAALNN